MSHDPDAPEATKDPRSEEGPQARGHQADDEAPGPEAPEEGHGRRRFDQVIPDLVRRTFYAGLGALFTTEEGLRKLAQDFHLPKDVANYLVQQAAASKDELFRIFARELRGFFENVNLSGELQKLLTSLSFEVKTEIRFIPNDEAVAGVKPNIRREVSVKRSGRKTKDEDDGGAKT